MTNQCTVVMWAPYYPVSLTISLTTEATKLVLFFIFTFSLVATMLAFVPDDTHAPRSVTQSNSLEIIL